MKLALKKAVLTFVVSSFVVLEPAFSQDSLEIKMPDFIKKSVRFKGTIGAESQLYFSQNTEARRPNNVVRLRMNTRIEQGLYLKIPLIVNVSSLPYQYGSFADANNTPNFTFEDYFYNPINTFATGIHYRSFKLNLGTTSPRYSHLSMGGLPMFGTEIDFSPGRFILKLNHGISQHAIQSDTTRSIPGQFQRTLTALKIGIGKEETSFLALNLMKGLDNVSSVTSPDSGLTAQEGLVVSLDFAARFTRRTIWKGEVAGSVFSDGLDVEKVDIDNSTVNTFNQLMPFRFSTFADYAAYTELSHRADQWGLSLKGEYIGAGYRSMGQPFIQPDRIDVTLNPNFSLFNKKLQFNLGGGYRVNNLVNTKTNTTSQLLFNGGITAAVNNNLNIAFTYNNFGVQNNVQNDTLRLRNVTNNVSLIPTYRFRTKGLGHSAGLIGSLNQFDDFNVVSGSLSSNNSSVYGANYSLSLDSLPLTLGLAVTQFDLSSSLIEVHATNINLNGAYRFFKDKLALDLGVTYSINRDQSNDASNQIILRLNTTYKAPMNYVFRLTASNNQFNYAATSGLDFYQENLINLSLTKRF